VSTLGFASSLTGKWHTTVAAVEVVMKSQSSRYLRGTRAGEEPVTIHAAVLRGQDEYTALCDNRAVVPLPGIFDPGDSAACPLCRSLAA
jgi:hypothetical protein